MITLPDTGEQIEAPVLYLWVIAYHAAQVVNPRFSPGMRRLVRVLAAYPGDPLEVICASDPDSPPGAYAEILRRRQERQEAGARR